MIAWGDHNKRWLVKHYPWSGCRVWLSRENICQKGKNTNTNTKYKAFVKGEDRALFFAYNQCSDILLTLQSTRKQIEVAIQFLPLPRDPDNDDDDDDDDDCDVAAKKSDGSFLW